MLWPPRPWSCPGGPAHVSMALWRSWPLGGKRGLGPGKRRQAWTGLQTVGEVPVAGRALRSPFAAAADAGRTLAEAGQAQQAMRISALWVACS